MWAGASQDYDTLLFGSPKLIRNLNITGRRKVAGREFYKKINIEYIELQKVLDSLEIDLDRLICLGILVGTDYNLKGIKGIGPKKALEIVKKHNYLDEIKKLEWNFEISFEEIFNWFKNPETIEKYDLTKKPLNREKIIKFLCDKHDFSLERVNNVLEKIESAKSTQTGLKSFFNQ